MFAQPMVAPSTPPTPPRHQVLTSPNGIKPPTDPEPQHDPAQVFVHIGTHWGFNSNGIPQVFQYAYVTIRSFSGSERVVKPSADGKRLVDLGKIVQADENHPRDWEHVYLTDRVSLIDWMASDRFHGELWCPHKILRC